MLLAILMQGSVAKIILGFEGVSSFGRPSSHHFRTRGIKMLWNGSTRPLDATSEQVAAAIIAPTCFSKGSLVIKKPFIKRMAGKNLQTRVARKSVIGEVFWVTLGSPRSARGIVWAAPGLLLAAAACSWSPLLSSSLSCCSPGLSCYSFALLQGAIFVIKSFIRFGSVLSLGGTSKQHFWGQGIRMLQNRSTKPSEPPTKYDPTMSPHR